MGLDNLTIVLKDPEQVFLPGDEVSGTVKISSPNEKVLKGMFVECQGFGKFYYDELKAETFVSTEKCYLNVKVPLVDIKGEGFQLSKGSHCFPFSFVLPRNIPASFQAETHSKSDYGHVHYTIKAVLERSSSKQSCGEIFNHNPLTTALKTQKPSYECTIPLIIKNLVDLNTIPSAVVPVESLKSQINFGFCCFRTGSITVKISLDRTGYVPGETIHLHIHVDNQSRKSLLGSLVSLVEDVDFHSYDKFKTYERIVVQEQSQGLKDPLHTVPLRIPNGLAPSYLEHCDIIDISYKIECVLFDEKRDRIGPFSLNVIIGNVPLSQKTPAPDEALISQVDNQQVLVHKENSVDDIMLAVE